MKKTKTILMMVLFTLVIGFTSCEKDDDDDNINNYYQYEQCWTSNSETAIEAWIVENGSIHPDKIETIEKHHQDLCASKYIYK